MCKCAFGIFFGFFSLPFLKQCALTHHSKIGWFLCLKKCIRSRLADNKKGRSFWVPTSHFIINFVSRQSLCLCPLCRTYVPDKRHRSITHYTLRHAVKCGLCEAKNRLSTLPLFSPLGWKGSTWTGTKNVGISDYFFRAKHKNPLCLFGRGFFLN